MFLFKRNVLAPPSRHLWPRSYHCLRPEAAEGSSEWQYKIKSEQIQIQKCFFGLNGTTVEGFVWIYVDLPDASSHLKMKVTKLQKKDKKVTWRTNFSVIDIEITQLWKNSANYVCRSLKIQHVSTIFATISTQNTSFFDISDFLCSSDHWKTKAILRSSTQRFIRARVKATFLSVKKRFPPTPPNSQKHWRRIIEHASFIINHHVSSYISRYHHVSSCIITNHHASRHPWWWISTIISETPDINRKTSNSLCLFCCYQCHDSSSVDPPKSPQNWTVLSLRVPMTRWCSPCQVPKVPTLSRNRR